VRSDILKNGGRGENVDYNQHIQHYGILGMKWGRRNPTIKDVERLSSKNEKLKAKIVKTDVKSANSQKLAVGYQQKLNNQQIKVLESGYSKSQIRKAKRLAKRYRQFSKSYARLDKRSAIYRKRIYKNTKLIEKFNMQIKEMDQQSIALGKSVVDEAFNKR
jgi:hypothetical protein